MDPRPTTPTTPGRPRSRGISFRSDRSGGSKGKTDPVLESPREKDRRANLWSGRSKANPNAALDEEQPGEANLHEESTLQNLRDIRHVDVNGQPIVEPDLSNPTRARFERPLDTIKSFEKAIDNGYKRRSSYMKQDAETWDQNNQFASRRSSYFGGNDGPTPGRFAQGGGYYGSQRPDSSHAGRHNGQSRARYGSRMQSDPQVPRVLPHHNYHQSYDAGNIGAAGSDSTGPWANSTDPSSENSSIDRIKPQTPMDGYGSHAPNGYGDTIMEEQGPGGHPQQQGNYGPGGSYGARGPQQMNGGNVRRPIPLGESHNVPGNLPANSRPEPEKKRKSWLKRRFSKG